MRRGIVIAVLLLFAHITWGQGGWTFQWKGFVNPHYYADSRAVVGGREDMMLFYPKPIARDSLNRDVNGGWQADMLAITARLGMLVKGPDVLGANVSAYLEGDFTGSTDATIDNLRLRHAYIDMRWERHRLIAGQYWYAMVVHEIMPMTNPLNMGSPFHCYARQPQFRYEYTPTKGLEVIGVASWQLDNMSQGLLNGALVRSTQFARHSMVPELTAQLRYRQGQFFVGMAANIKTIQPIVNTYGMAAEQTLHSSFTYSFFGQYTTKHIAVKAQTLLNNSLYEGCSLGGYLMLADGSFTDWHFNTVWVDISRNEGSWRPGLFLGFAHNLNYDNTDYTYCFGRGHEIEYLWRIQPRLTYAAGNGLEFTAEAEYTRAGYAEAVGNLRLSLSAVYSFSGGKK